MSDFVLTPSSVLKGVWEDYVEPCMAAAGSRTMADLEPHYNLWKAVNMLGEDRDELFVADRCRKTVLDKKNPFALIVTRKDNSYRMDLSDDEYDYGYSNGYRCQSSPSKHFVGCTNLLAHMFWPRDYCSEAKFEYAVEMSQTLVTLLELVADKITEASMALPEYNEAYTLYEENLKLIKPLDEPKTREGRYGNIDFFDDQYREMCGSKPLTRMVFEQKMFLVIQCMIPCVCIKGMDYRPVVHSYPVVTRYSMLTSEQKKQAGTVSVYELSKKLQKGLILEALVDANMLVHNLRNVCLKIKEALPWAIPVPKTIKWYGKAVPVSIARNIDPIYGVTSEATGYPFTFKNVYSDMPNEDYTEAIDRIPCAPRTPPGSPTKRITDSPHKKCRYI